MVNKSNVGLKEDGIHLIKFISKPKLESFHMILYKSENRQKFKMGYCSGDGCDVCNMAKLKYKNGDKYGYRELKKRDKIHGYGTIDGVDSYIMLAWAGIANDYGSIVRDPDISNYDFEIKTTHKISYFPSYELNALYHREDGPFYEDMSIDYKMAEDLITDDMVVQYTKELLV